MTFGANRADARVIDMRDIAAPCLVADIDVADGVPDVMGDQSLGSAHCLWMLVRMHTQPLGIVMMAVPPEGLRRLQVVAGLTEVLGAELACHAGVVGETWPAPEAGRQFAGARLSPFLSSRREVLAQAPRLTVVVCTRERPSSLKRCLDSLVHQDYPRFSILVVDNAPSTDQARDVVAQFRSRSIGIAYVVEPRAGLSRARNRAIHMVNDEIIAWIDDDEVADRFWLAELARGFFDHPEAGAVAGIMLPAELKTSAQVRFEQYGGHHKARGFVASTFSPRTASLQSPLFPLPPFGTGGNMAFRREALTEIGGFDPALGAGSLSLAGEDSRAFTELLLLGGTVVYQPSAITHHFHRGSHDELRQQRFSYGVGLTAFYTSLLLSRPGCAAGLIQLSPTFLREAFGPASLRSGQLPRDFPSDLLWANRQGLIVGPVRYLVARLVARYRDRRDARSGHVGHSDISVGPRG